ncbi:hypothetical protein GPECTOR_442g326 [Gonium pectorale]|uniref:Uncharacterized protein n=1 Tax=Gonium pectorale TaxID=33097 RepID=A0A150FV34_GONPE|nr:hypothetical protein GPECTOR_442g326 [Gonium pectorale]|eukprot:KXZ41481.1 hypothetical protein GPECTOR_442g326 [Gonium pectorale]
MLSVAETVDEEMFVKRALAQPRRIRSAAPGASRLLSARIEYYRNNLDLALLHEDRRVRDLRALRKEAAIKIAAWYKKILIKRRQRELADFIARFRQVMLPHVMAQREAARQRAAERLLHFMRFAAGANMAVVGVRKLKAGVELLQSAWRTSLLVRGVQLQSLCNQVARLERELVAANRRAERNMQTHLMRLGKSVNILEPDAALLPSPAPAGAGAAAGGGGGGGGGGGHARPLRSPGAVSVALGPASGPASPAAGSRGMGSAHAHGHGHGGFLEGAGAARALELVGVATGTARQYDRSRQPPRGVLHDPGEEEDEVLRGHTELMPREVREQAVEAFLFEARRAHRRLLEQYSADKAVYLARKPIEEMRQRMLRDADSPP